MLSLWRDQSIVSVLSHLLFLFQHPTIKVVPTSWWLALPVLRSPIAKFEEKLPVNCRRWHVFTVSSLFMKLSCALFPWQHIPLFCHHSALCPGWTSGLSRTWGAQTGRRRVLSACFLTYWKWPISRLAHDWLQHPSHGLLSSYQKSNRAELTDMETELLGIFRMLTLAGGRATTFPVTDTDTVHVKVLASPSSQVIPTSHSAILCTAAADKGAA